MNLTPRVGHCLISPDPDYKQSPGGIIYPKSLQGKAKTGFVHLHTPSSAWDEVDLTGRRVVFDRWSSRPFTLQLEDKQHEFGVVSQWAILGVFEEEEDDGYLTCSKCGDYVMACTCYEQEEAKRMQGLKTGRMVYYVAYGTPGGEYPSGVERAAVVTEVPKIGEGGDSYAECQEIDSEGTQTTIGLCILNPTGLFFTRGVRFNTEGKPGTWHWMFEGQQVRYQPDRTEKEGVK